VERSLRLYKPGGNRDDRARNSPSAMPQRKSSSPQGISIAKEEPARPEVIVDFRFEQGLLYIALVNISAVPAYRVSVRFDKPFRGLGGECDVSSLRLFRRVEFLAPHKRIETLLDSSRAYFQRREPTAIKATVAFRDAAGKAQTREIAHDLRIYQELSYVVRHDPSLSPPILPAVPCPASPAPEKESPYGNPKRETLRPIQFPR
jgi:hypothetical protein